MNEISVKHDNFAVFIGEEYQFVTRNGEIVLVSIDPKDLEKGFEPYSATKYIRKVKKEELDVAYRCTTHARYRELECLIIDINLGTQQVLLRYFQSYRLAEEHGFQEVDRMVYEKQVAADQIGEAWYEFEPLMGFELVPGQHKQIIHI